MGINAARRIFTGRGAARLYGRVLLSLQHWAMLDYDLRLGSIALLLTMIRAAVILATNAWS